MLEVQGTAALPRDMLSDESPAGPIVYHVNAFDDIVEVNDAWTRFALLNDAGELARERVIGKPLWRFISDATTRLMYHALVSRAREGRAVTFGYRCDGPTMTRAMRMTIAGLPNGDVRFESVVVAEAPLRNGVVWDRRAGRTEEMLRVCSWCKKVATAGQWIEVDAAVDALGLFMGGRLPQLTHGMCPSCQASVAALLDEANPT